MDGSPLTLTVVYGRQMVIQALVVLRLDGKSIHRLFKTFDVENRFSF